MVAVRNRLRMIAVAWFQNETTETICVSEQENEVDGSEQEEPRIGPVWVYRCPAIPGARKVNYGSERYSTRPKRSARRGGESRPSKLARKIMWLTKGHGV
jgi:hypothetical protein